MAIDPHHLHESAHLGLAAPLGAEGDQALALVQEAGRVGARIPGQALEDRHRGARLPELQERGEAQAIGLAAGIARGDGTRGLVQEAQRVVESAGRDLRFRADQVQVPEIAASREAP